MKELTITQHWRRSMLYAAYEECEYKYRNKIFETSHTILLPLILGMFGPFCELSSIHVYYPPDYNVAFSNIFNTTYISMW